MGDEIKKQVNRMADYKANHIEMGNGIQNALKAAFVTGSGAVTLRPGKLLVYPDTVAWARLQALYNRSKGASDFHAFPFASSYTQSYAKLKHRDSVQALVAYLMICSPADVVPFAQSQFKYLNTVRSIAGMEDVFLSTMNSLGRNGSTLVRSRGTLFDAGAKIWQRLKETCTDDTILLVDKELSCAAGADGGELSNLDLVPGKPGLNKMGFMGGLRGGDIPFAVQNPLDRAIGSLYGGALTEGGCVGLFAVGGGLIGSSGGWSGAAMGMGIGAGIGKLYCGVIYDKPEKSSTADQPGGKPSKSSSPGQSGQAETPKEDMEYDPDQDSGGEGDSEDDGGTCDPGYPPDDNGGIPDPEGDDNGGPWSLGMRSYETSIPSGDGLKGLISYGQNGIAIMHDLPSVDFASGSVLKAGFAATLYSSNGQTSTLGQLSPADFVTIMNLLKDRSIFDKSAPVGKGVVQI